MAATGKRTRDTTEFTCAVCLAVHPLERREGAWKLMKCSAAHGPSLCAGECFQGWVETNPSCPVCRESWTSELEDGPFLAVAKKINSAFDSELAEIEEDEREAFHRLQRGDDRMYQRRDFVMERMVVMQRKYKALAEAKEESKRPKRRRRSPVGSRRRTTVHRVAVIMLR